MAVFIYVIWQMMVTLYLQNILAGFCISLSGSLPLGNLNVAAMQIAARETLKKGLLFAAGVTLVEMFYLRGTLGAIDLLAGNDRLFFYCRVATVALLLILAAGSFMALRKKESRNLVVENNANKFALGVTMSALNPMQIPFWAGWVIYLLSAAWLTKGNVSFNIFTLSAGLGTFAALLVFIMAGRKFAAFMQNNRKTIDVIMGCLFLIMAAFQLIKLV